MTIEMKQRSQNMPSDRKHNKSFVVFLQVSTVAKPRPIRAGASSQRRGSEKPHFCPFFPAYPNATK
jgi:hypothetical protein